MPLLCGLMSTVYLVIADLSGAEAVGSLQNCAQGKSVL